MGYDYSYHFCNLQQSGYSEHLESLDHMDMHRKTMPTCEPSGVGSHVKLPKLCQVCVVSWRWKNAIALSTNSKSKVDSIWYHVYIYIWYTMIYHMIYYDTLWYTTRSVMKETQTAAPCPQPWRLSGIHEGPPPKNSDNIRWSRKNVGTERMDLSIYPIKISLMVYLIYNLIYI